MDPSILMEYLGVFFLLVLLEGLLAVDNAVVLSLMVKHLPENEQKKVLNLGLTGSFLFRFGALFLISFLADVWQVQAIGSLYLGFMAVNGVWKQTTKKEKGGEKKTKDSKGFWKTVIKIGFTDAAFAVDSILAAVAISMMLQPLPIGKIGGLNGGHFLIVLAGGLTGILIMKFAATTFGKLLMKRPRLETVAYFIVGWVGVKLGVLTLAHPDVQLITESFAHSTIWKITFYGGLIGIVVVGWLISGKIKVTSIPYPKNEKTKREEAVA